MNTDFKANARRALLLGHFSTVGDIACLDFVSGCLREKGIPFDTCAFMDEVRKNLASCLSPQNLTPGNYSHLIFICGPCWPEMLAQQGINIAEFAHCSRIAVNTTMILPVKDWNPFQHLLERDSDRHARPDLSFYTPMETVPVAGLCLIGEQGEYGDRQRHRETSAAIHALLKKLGWARIDLDTRWPRSRNATNVDNPAGFLSLVRKVDVLITNRLHGLVFALKGGVPVLAVDSIAGGDKVSKQAQVLNWPGIFRSDELDLEKMAAAAAWCISEEGRMAAQKVARQLAPAGNLFRKEFFAALNDDRVDPLAEKYRPVLKVPDSKAGVVRRLKKFLRF